VEFTLRIQGTPGSQTIACSGPLTAATAIKLDEAIELCMQEPRSILSLDCSRVTSLDFAGVSALLRGLQACRERGVRLRAIFSAEAQRVLDAAGLWWVGVADGGVSIQTALVRARRFFADKHSEPSQPALPDIRSTGDDSLTARIEDLHVDIREPSSRKRVLLVDDDVGIRHVLRVLFEVEEFEVVGEASDGIEAVALALKHAPDFIIIDYAMPRMDGAKAATILQVTVPDARIVAFSAYLDSKPDWAHAYLNKDRIVEIIPVMQALISEDGRPTRTEPVYGS
jgi:CheY-like chemotaxis protein/anti-anti-sigma regulatory factor